MTEPQLKALMQIYNGTQKVLNANTTFALEEKKLIVRHIEAKYPQVLTHAGINELVEAELLVDLFEHYQKQPKELEAVCAKWLELAVDGLEYNQCEQWLKEVEAIGYTFDYYLQGEPFNLVKIPVSGIA